MKKVLKGFMKRGCSLLLVIVMLLTSLLPQVVLAAPEGESAYATISVEAFSVGGGYIVEPIRVPITSGEKVSDVFEAALTQKGYTSTTVTEGTYYVTGITGSFSFTPALPASTSASVQAFAETNGDPIRENSEQTLDMSFWTPGTLKAGDFATTSGWMYAYNNEMPDTTMNNVEVQDGDVIRVQYSMMWGDDIGAGYGGTGLDPANKDELTSFLAEVNSAANSAELLADSTVRNAYDAGVQAAALLGNSQEAVSGSATTLRAALDNFIADQPSLTLSPKEAGLLTGESVQLTAALQNLEGEPQWVSDAPEVASVDSTGLVEALTAGSATITASIGEVQDTCVITVTQAPQDEEKVDAVLAKVQSSWLKLAAVSPVDTNVITLFNTWIAAQTDLNTQGITAALKSSSDTDYVAQDGSITYMQPQTTPGSIAVKNVTLVFTLSCGEVVKDTQNITVQLGWDKAAMLSKMNAEADVFTADFIKKDNTDLENVTQDLTLPQIASQSYSQAWSVVSWESSNTDVIRVESTDPYGGYATPLAGKVTRPAEDTQVTLTATFGLKPQCLNDKVNPDLTFTKTFTVTVLGEEVPVEDGDAIRAEMQAKLDKYYVSDLLTDFVTKEKLDLNQVVGDIQLPIPSRIAVDTGDTKFVSNQIKVTSDNTEIASISGYRVNVDVFAAADTTLNLTVTYTKTSELGNTYSVQKVFPITVRMISEAELDAEIALMEAVKAHYFDGLNDGANLNQNTIVNNLHAFKEAVFAEDGQTLVWAYHIDDTTGTGIIPTDIDPDDQMGVNGYRLFKSTDNSLIRHENLLVTLPETEKQVTISSVLTSARFGEWAKSHPENAKLQKVYRQPVEVTVTVKTQAYVDAQAALQTALGELAAKVTEAEQIDTTLYTAESVSLFDTALQAAQNILSDDSMTDLTAEVVTAAKASLEAAIRGLVYKSADLSGLQEEIERAQSLDSALFTETSFAAVTNILGEARLLVAAQPVILQQTQVNALAESLKQAIDGLVYKESQSRLKSLKFSETGADSTLLQSTPGFEKNTFAYDVSVYDYLTSFYVYAETENTQDVLKYYVRTSMGTTSIYTHASGPWRGVSTTGSADIPYKLSNDASKLSSTAVWPDVTVYNIHLNKIATLKNLSVNETIKPSTFDKNVREYQAYIPAGQTTVDITASGYSSDYKVRAGEVEGKSDKVISVPVVWDGDTMEVPVTVYSADTIASTYTVILHKEPTADVPDILLQPTAGQNYVDTDAATPIKVKASANGSLSYQWFKNTTESTQGGVKIDGATAASYQPTYGLVTQTETYYYYCVITNTNTQGSYDTTTDLVHITVKPDPTPYDVQLVPSDGSELSANGYFCAVGDEAQEVKVTFKSRAQGGVENNTYKYQWWTKDASGTGSGSTKTTDTFSFATTLNRARYISCVVTIALDGVTYKSDYRNAVLFTVYAKGITATTISKQPVAAEYVCGAADVLPLSVTISNNISGMDNASNVPQWYVSDDNVTFAAIEGATELSYTPPATSEPSAKYYKCKITSRLVSYNGRTYTAAVDSDAVKVGFSTLEEIVGETLWDGEGTQENPYLLKTADDLLLMQRLVNEKGINLSGKYLKMANDITLPEAWVPIGSLKPGMTSTSNGKYINPFSGTFDGGNFTLTVPEDGLPLCGYVRFASVQNLNIYGTKIAGYGLINNFTVDYGATGVYNDWTALGAVTANIDKVTLKSGTKTLKAGFLGGYASAANIVNFNNCLVEEGVIIGYDKSQTQIGSFAGNLAGTINNCHSYATVYGTDRVGGLAGSKGEAMGVCRVINSSFQGTVEATGKYVGGIFGSGYTSASAPNTPCVSVQNCFVRADITGGQYVGGILGAEPVVVQCWANGVGAIQNNYFYGTLSGDVTGGIIGLMHSLDRYNIIENNYFYDLGGTTDTIGHCGYDSDDCQGRYEIPYNRCVFPFRRPVRSRC
ncbi:MAG: Ig-like domain-containing protein [Lachnospiraceae bacterium]